MNKNHRIVSLITVIVLVLGIQVAGWAEGSKESSAGKPVKLQLSHQMAASHSINQTSLKFAELVKEKTGGSVTVEVFPSATLGTERENLEALKTGTLDMAIIAVEFYPAFVEEAGVFVLPFMYDSYEHQTRALKGDAGKKLAEIILDRTGVKVLSYYSLAFRQIFTTDAPVKTVSDLKGLKIRVPESPTYVNTFNLLGAAPTPVAWGETYTALETGVVGGLENTPESIYSASMHEVVNYMNLSDHISAPTTFSISNAVYKKLTPEQQAQLIDAAKEAGAFGLELTIKNDSEFREKLKTKLEIIQMDKSSLRNAIDYSAFNVMRLNDAKTLKNLIDSVR